MITTEKPECSNFKKDSFERAIALIHAGPPKQFSFGRFLLGLGALVQNQVIRTPPGTQPTYISSEKNTGPSLVNTKCQNPPAAVAERRFFKTQRAEDIDAICV